MNGPYRKRGKGRFLYGSGTTGSGAALVFQILEGQMRGMLLWFIGIPIPVIILLYLFHVI
jgi:hypothetical protein